MLVKQKCKLGIGFFFSNKPFLRFFYLRIRQNRSLKQLTICSATRRTSAHRGCYYDTSWQSYFQIKDPSVSRAVQSRTSQIIGIAERKPMQKSFKLKSLFICRHHFYASITKKSLYCQATDWRPYIYISAVTCSLRVPLIARLLASLSPY